MLARARSTLLCTRLPPTAPSSVCLHATSRGKLPVLEMPSCRFNQEGLYIALLPIIYAYKFSGKLFLRRHKQYCNSYQTRGELCIVLQVPLLAVFLRKHLSIHRRHPCESPIYVWELHNFTCEVNLVLTKASS